MLRKRLTNISGVVAIHATVLLDILELLDTREGVLTLGQVEARVRVVDDIHIGNTSLQYPLTIYNIKVAHLVEAIGYEALDQTNRVILTDYIVVLRQTHRRTPTGRSIGQSVLRDLVDVANIIRIGSVDREVEILRANEVSTQSYLDTLVRGLSHILILVGVTRRSINGQTHQVVVGRVPVAIDATTQATVPHAEVNTNVTRGGRLPHQVRIRFHLTRYIDRRYNTVNGDGRGLPGRLPQRCADVIRTRGTIRYAELQVIEPIARVLHELLVRDAPCGSSCGEVTPTVVGSKLRRTIGTERSGQQVLALVTVVHTTKPRQRAVRRTNLSRELILTPRRVGHVDHTESIAHRKLSGITGTGDRRRVRVRSKYLITGQNVQAVILAQTLNLVVQSRSPTNAITMAVVQLRYAIARLLTSVPALRLLPVAAERELGLSRQTLHGLPGQTSASANALQLRNTYIVIQRRHGAKDLLDIGRTHTQIRRIVRTQRLVNRVPLVSRGSQTVLRTLGLHIRVTKVGVEGQRLRELLRQLHIGAPTTVARLDTDTLIVSVVHRCIVLRLLATTRNRHIVVPRAGRLHDVLHVVVSLHTLVIVVVVAILRAEAVVLCNTLLILRTVCLSIGPDVVDVVLSIETLDQLGQVLDLVVTVVANRCGLLLLTTLRRNEDNTVSTASTVDSRRSSVLQYIQRLDVVGRDVRNVVYLDTINDEERVVRLRDRTATTNADRHRSTRTTVLRGDLYTRQLTLQGLGDVRNGVSHQLLTRYRSHRTGQVATLYRTVTNDHDILDARGVLLHRHRDLGALANSNTLLLHTDVRNNDHIVCCIGQIQGELTIHIGSCTKGGTIDNNRRTDNRQTVSVLYPPP